MLFNMHIGHCHSISFLLHIIIATIKTLFMHLFFSFPLNHIQVFLVHIEEISLMSLRWCMGHLSTLTWMKVHNTKNPFTGLEFTIFTILYKCMTKMFQKCLKR